jgi:uncharacterized protein DUF1963
VKEEICLMMFAVIFITAMVFLWLNVTDAIKVRSARRAFQALSVESRQQILKVIDESASSNVACTVLVPWQSDGSTILGNAASSRYGGLPYAETGDQWPTSQDQPADFLIQVELGQTLPSPWPGRLLEVFYRTSSEAIVRSYAAPQIDHAIKITGGPPAQPEWILRPVRIPGDRVLTPLLAYDPYVLLKAVPNLQAEVARFSRRTVDLLSLVLAPNQRFATGFELSDIVQMGGEPVWLFDDPGDQSCPACGRAMRFLLQFGDLNRTDILGDGGVCYVFGCDLHPDQANAVVQLG